MHRLRLRLLPDHLAVGRFPPGTDVDLPMASTLAAVIATPDEVTVVGPESSVSAPRVEAGWRAYVVDGPLDFDLVGVLSALTEPLAAASISVFALSTYDTDYLMVRSHDVDRANAALAAAGHQID